MHNHKGELENIAAKVAAGERLTREDGVKLYQSNDLLAIGKMADLVRKRKNGTNTFFIVNRHINHTNVCINRCKLCAFGRDANAPGAYTMSLDEIEAKARASANSGISEIHIVGGLNPELKLDYYVDMLQRVRRVLPGVVIQSFTAVEIDYLAQLHGMTHHAVLRALQEAGLDSLPGGGAEIFAPRVREIICSKKINGDKWLAVHRAAHELGMRTNATMLYGHVETIEERVDHLLRLRELQDRTGGFLTFIPLAFHPKNTALEPMGLAGTTGYDDLKTLAVARLLLDNFDHIKAFWVMVGPKMAQVSLSFGVDDLDGTVVEEKIAHDAGAETGQSMAKSELVRMIKNAGFCPVQRDTLYNVVEEGF
ncbi:aminofutalosine synthase MqnE [Desulfoscipio geothermicus]|uniref:Aminodeoxyfutalosine synthase n=1 Tax=Desulfoscipio geothermicus DSM 3669 TaxID=1121426 RepID=A0A1I6DX89_9FIRM|nr:aminofutalosine synthase MqnE [Desulfoscipio geothermicus]SFR10046.1 de-hypoxanthine futalosine cyclase [Desulfoscipio geothermicus DSM 3669]